MILLVGCKMVGEEVWSINRRYIKVALGKTCDILSVHFHSSECPVYIKRSLCVGLYGAKRYGYMLREKCMRIKLGE